MNTRLPISAFIIAKNEADRIGQTIDSVKDWVEEVIVIDSGSTDGTQETAAAHGATVLFNSWNGYGLQKRYGEDKCKNNWLLNLDADEVITPALRDEIIALFAQGEPAHQGYKLHVVEIFPGDTKPPPFAHQVICIRLYDKRYGRFSDSSVHDTVRMEKGTVGSLQPIVEHRSMRSIEHMIEKLNRYSSMQAADMFRKQPVFSFGMKLRLYVEFPLNLLKALIVRGYLFKGTYGFAIAMSYAFHRFSRLAKYYEATRKGRR